MAYKAQHRPCNVRHQQDRPRPGSRRTLLLWQTIADRASSKTRAKLSEACRHVPSWIVSSLATWRSPMPGIHRLESSTKITRPPFTANRCLTSRTKALGASRHRSGQRHATSRHWRRFLLCCCLHHLSYLLRRGIGMLFWKRLVKYRAIGPVTKPAPGNSRLVNVPTTIPTPR